MVEPISGINAQTWRPRQQKQRRVIGVRAWQNVAQSTTAHVRRAVGVLSPVTRGRFVASVAALGVGLATVALVGHLRSEATHAAFVAPASLTTRVTVKRGETLWSFAHHYGNPNVYILDRVDELAQANGLDADTRLVPGQRLLVTVGTRLKLPDCRHKAKPAWPRQKPPGIV